jgi:hypothetical protein
MATSEPRDFEIKVGSRELSLNAQNCVAVMFRKHCEVDYLSVNVVEDEENRILRIFNNARLVRWMAGICITESGYELTTADDEAFADEYGFNPTIIIKQEPSDAEKEYFLDVNMRNIDKEWNDGIE